MAVPTLSGVTQATADPSWGTSFTPTLSGFSAGALLVIVGVAEDTMTSGVPSGWTRLGITSSLFQLFVDYKTAAGSDTIPTYDLNTFERFSWTTFYVASGFDTSTPLEGWATGSGVSDNPIAPSITAADARDRSWITAFAHGSDGSAGDTITAPSGHTLLGAGHKLDYLGHGAARKDTTSSGATGTATYTYAPGNDWRSISFFVNPTAAGGGSSSVPVRDRYAPRGLNRGMAA